MVDIFLTEAGKQAVRVILAKLQELGPSFRVHRISKADDLETESLLELYGKMFPDTTQDYTKQEIDKFVSTGTGYMPDCHVRVENIVLVATQDRKTVGFLMSHYYPDYKKAIISYLGIDREESDMRRLGSCALINELIHQIGNKQRPCDYLFFDLHVPSSSEVQSLSPIEREDRIGRPRLFRKAAKKFGLNTYTLDFDYFKPKVSLREQSEECPLILGFVPLRNFEMPRHLAKDYVMNFLKFMYFCCYGDVYSVNHRLFRPYHKYLEKLLNRYEKSLPEEIKVKILDGLED